MLQFGGSVITSDAGLLAYRALDDALGLTEMAIEKLADARTGRNGRHAMVGLLRQSVFGRLAGYEDVNDAEPMLPKMTVAVQTSRQSCKKARKAPIFTPVWEPSGNPGLRLCGLNRYDPLHGTVGVYGHTMRKYDARE